MRVLFIANFSIIEPLGLIYLMGVVKKLGHTGRIVLVKDYDFDPVDKALLEFKPDLVGLNIFTGNHRQFLAYSQKLRKQGVATVVGGPHPTYFDQECLSFADYVVKGEGFAAFRKVLTGEVKPGIIFSGELLSEGFPIPDREAFYAENHVHRDNKIKNSITAIGCPYTCGYCYNSSYNDLYGGFKLKTRPIGDVIAELKEIKERWPCEVIYFQDDVLGFDINWLADFTELYRKEINIPWHAQIRLELTRDPKRLQLFKRGGCFGITASIESSDSWIRNSLMNRKMPDELIYEGCRRIKEAGLLLRTEQMLGTPGCDLNIDLKTLEMNVKIRPDIAWSSVFAPYRGTYLGELCVREGYYRGNNDDLDDSFFARSAMVFYYNDRGWNPKEADRGKRTPFTEEENNDYKDKMAILQNLFNYFAYVPNGHILAKKFLDRKDFTFKVLGEMIEAHLADNGYSGDKLEEMRTELWRTTGYQKGKDEDFESLAHYFTMLPAGEKLALRFLNLPLCAREFKDLSVMTRRHLYDEVLYKIPA